MITYDKVSFHNEMYRIQASLIHYFLFFHLKFLKISYMYFHSCYAFS